MVTHPICALLVDDAEIEWELQGSHWVAVRGTDLARPELIDCLPEGEDAVLDWSTEPSMYIFSTGWSHVLYPSDREGEWFGTAAPIAPSEACLTALEVQGLEIPVSLAVQVLSIE